MNANSSNFIGEEKLALFSLLWKYGEPLKCYVS